MSLIKRKLFLKFIEHPKLVFTQILKALKWQDGRVYEDHQNSHLFILPAEILAEIRLELQSIVGKKVAKNMLYNLNQLSADAIIKDAIEQDFKEKDLLRYFLAIMSLFGWGSAEQFEFDPVTGKGIVSISRFPQSSKPQPEPVHDDFSGILARALELSYGKKCEVREISCCEMGKGDVCTYEIQPITEGSPAMVSKIDIQDQAKLDAKNISSPPDFERLIEQISMPESGVLVYGEKNALKRLIIKDVASINSMFLKTADLIGWKTIGPICFRVGRNTALNEIAKKKPLDLKKITDYLQELSYFGWGLFNLEDKGSGIYYVIVTNSPFTAGFPIQQTATDYLLAGVLEGLFEALEGNRVNVKEVECTAKGDKRCLFEITPLGFKKTD